MRRKATLLIIILTCTLNLASAKKSKHRYLSIKGGYTHIQNQKDSKHVSKDTLLKAFAQVNMFTHQKLYIKDGVDPNSVEFNLVKHAYKENFNFSAAVGDKIGPIRMEFEIGYMLAKINEFIFDFKFIKNGHPIVDRTHSRNNVATGFLATSMINGYFDFPIRKNISSFLGIGLGVVDVNIRVKNNEGANFSTSQTEFAYQAMAGAQFAVNKSFKIIAEYKFTGTAKAQVSNEPLADIRNNPLAKIAPQTIIRVKHYDNFFTHSINIGFIMAIT